MYRQVKEPLIYCLRDTNTFHDPFFFFNLETPKLPNVTLTGTFTLIFDISKLQTYYILQRYQLLPISDPVTANCNTQALALSGHVARRAHLATNPLGHCISPPDRHGVWLAQGTVQVVATVPWQGMQHSQ